MAKTPKTYPQAKCLGGSWSLEQNDVWNVPAGREDVRGEMATSGGIMPTIYSYRALAMDQDGFVYGMKSLNNPRESGHDLEGKVRIDGKVYRAFTSSKLFERPDGSLCDVAILYVCKSKDAPVPVPDLDSASDAVLEEIQSKYHYEFHGGDHDSPRALLQRYATITLGLRRGWAEQYPHVGYPEERERVYSALPAWAKFRKEAK